jgi:hypothetical protein
MNDPPKTRSSAASSGSLPNLALLPRMSLTTPSLAKMTNRSKGPVRLTRERIAINGRHRERIVALLVPSSSLHLKGVQMQSCRAARAHFLRHG